MARRSRAREIVLQLAYEFDRNPEVSVERALSFIQERLPSEELWQFAGELIQGLRAEQPRLDAAIGKVTENWSLGRITPVDRSILRLGTYELLCRSDIPEKVSINEAIELAKRYGTEDSPRFVNGILDRIRQRAREE